MKMQQIMQRLFKWIDATLPAIERNMADII